MFKRPCADGQADSGTLLVSESVAGETCDGKKGLDRSSGRVLSPQFHIEHLFSNAFPGFGFRGRRTLDEKRRHTEINGASLGLQCFYHGLEWVFPV
jgi:hypothetical protein